jgi:hypothetical protein
VPRERGPASPLPLRSEAEKCPAAHAIGEITRHFDELAWKPLMEDFLNPGISTSLVRGWTNYQDDVRHQYVWQWQGQWESDKGEIATYDLKYTNAFGRNVM